MNVVQQILRWEQPRHKVLFLVLRVILGSIIVIKGIIFLRNIEYLDTLLKHSIFRWDMSFWVYYIAFAHLLGGIFIIMGLLTRVAVLLQVPMLAGAVFCINHWDCILLANGECILSLFVLAMLFYFLAKGSGEISVDRYLKNHLL